MEEMEMLRKNMQRELMVQERLKQLQKELARNDSKGEKKMKSNKLSKERGLYDLSSAYQVEQTINSLVQDLFNEMKARDKVADANTLKFTINDRKIGRPSIRVECIIRDASGRKYEPEAIYRNGRNTAVKWEDGSVTTVKRAEDEPESEYAAFTAALGIRVMGSNTRLKKIMEKKTIIQKKVNKK